MSVVLIQKIDILLYQMKNKVRPLRKSSDAPISDTSRNELKQKQMGSHSMQSNQFSLSNLRLRFFINRLIKKIKFLAPPNRKPDNVKEQWQKMLEQMQSSKRLKQLQIFKKQTLSQQITSRNTIIPVIQFFHAILIVVFSWAVTTSLIFKIHLFISVYVMLAIVNILELGLKISIIWSEQNQQTTYQVYWREDFIQPLYLFFAALLMIVRHFFSNPYFQTFLIIFQFVCVFIQWKNIGKYFSFLTLYAQQNKKRKQLRIIQLFCFTLVMAHIFALVMYSMTYYTPEGQKNWIQKASLVGKPWYVLYIYTYYWANTTMVTVGYGDLTPSNYFEAIIITLIQIVGTAIFGYMINVIGITVNEIQKKNVEFEQYQSTIFKLKDHYQLSRELCYKMKSDIKKKEFEMKQTPLKNNEQRQFLQYVDPTLKEQFVLQTNMKVIKKSIFFLTHFTVNCQNQIALKLIRCIYKPDELINFQENGQKQMVIINSGKVNVFYKKIHHNQDIAKVVRVIKPSEEKPALNVYGYSSLILNRNINLKAVTQQTTTAYILKRSDIIDSIGKNILDFQSFNELRQRMLQYAYPQEIQAPALIQQENHFIPNIFLLIKKIKNSSQSRLKTTRNKRKQRMKVITIKHYQNKTLLLIPNQRKPQQDDFQLNFLNQVQDIDKLARKDTPRHNPNSKIILLEQGKDFVNFLKNYNLSVIAEQYEKACLRKSYFKRRIEGWSFRSKKTNNPYAF